MSMNELMEVIPGIVAIAEKLISWADNNAVAIFAIIIAVFLIIYLVIKNNKKDANEKEEFAEFIKYLMKKKFVVLPKICLELSLKNKYNDLKIGDMLIEYDYDMTNAKMDNVTNYPIDYPIYIDYTLNVKNLKIPKNFGYYFTNSHKSPKKDLLKVYQKHGKQKDITEVPLKSEEVGTLEPMIRRNSYMLSDKRNIFEKLKRNFQIFFKIQYKEEGLIKKDRIIFYPKQFGNKMKDIEIKIKFSGEKVKITKAEGFFIYKDRNDFDEQSIFKKDISDQEVYFKIPDVGKTDNKAGYIDIYWESIK